MIPQEEVRQMGTKIAWGFLGTPYIWGGDDPMLGFDCSGFIVEVLKSVGVLPRKGDWNAASLCRMFEKAKVDTVHEGCLVFWQNRARNRIIHVEYALNHRLCIGASGGGSENTTVQDAIDKNAYIKVRPWQSRTRVFMFTDPYEGVLV